MQAPRFTPKDAEDIITIAQEAPIPGGMRQAKARSDLFQRFQAWAESKFNEEFRDRVSQETPAGQSEGRTPC